MKVYVINGSPRHDKNTMKMLNAFIKGFKSVLSVDFEYINLYDIDFKGCASCFACQSDNDITYGKCNRLDDIHSVLMDLPNAEGVVFGSPIYLGTISSTLHAFLERLIYQFLDFSGTKSDTRDTNAPKKLDITTIYTMNITHERMIESGTEKNISTFENYLESIFRTKVNRVCAYNTYQYDNYKNYRVGLVDEQAKKIYRDENFKYDLENAFEAGVSMAKKVVINL